MEIFIHIGVRHLLVEQFQGVLVTCKKANLRAKEREERILQHLAGTKIKRWIVDG